MMSNGDKSVVAGAHLSVIVCGIDHDDVESEVSTNVGGKTPEDFCNVFQLSHF